MKVALAIMLSASVASAASHYIRAGATGDNDGSSWANAWQTLAAVSWVRGDTFYIAGGTYSGNLSISLAGTSWLTIKKANAADNSGDAGWSSAYATDQAVIACSNSDYCVRLLSGNIEFNGVTGSGASGHGILVTNSFLVSGTEPAAIIMIGGGVSPIRLFHLELAGTGHATQERGGDGIYNNNTGVKQKGLHINSCYIHGVDKNGMTLGGLEGTSYSDYGLLFENSVIKDTGGSTSIGWHGQGIQYSYANTDNYTIMRNNSFINIEGSGMIVFMDGANAHNNALLYNNLFYLTDTIHFLTISPHVIGNIGGGNCTNILIANNTFYNIGVSAANLAQVRFYTAPCLNVQLTNNVWENCNFTGSHIVSSQGYNGYYNNSGGGVPSGTPNQVDGASTTFNAPASYDFSLKAGGYAVSAGADLSAIFTTDFLGRTRSVWDIGAYAYNAKQSKITNVRVQNLRIGVGP